MPGRTKRARPAPSGEGVALSPPSGDATSIPPPHALLSLPECLLSRVASLLDPAPDLFALASTCARLRSVCAAPHLTRVYVDPGLAAELAEGRRERRPPRARVVCATLEAALSVARPGDTVRLSQGVHACPDEGLVVNKSVRIEGGANGARVAAPAPSAATPPTLTLAARSAGVSLHNITLDGAPSSPALLHVAGAARIDACRVLGHLQPPVVSAAVAVPPEAPPSARAAAPGGCLTISETIVSGSRGGAAVRADGSGRVAAVRGVPLPRGSVLLWCEVDAAGLDNDAGCTRKCFDL